jgi:hypothetical protein
VIRNGSQFLLHYWHPSCCFVNCLMTDRNIADYKHFFQTLKIKIRQVTGHRWRPRRVICDFEQALLVAVETELRHAQISGC